MEREKERGGTAGTGKSQSHSDPDGVSESENKREGKTLKVMCFILIQKKKCQAHLLDHIHTRNCGYTWWR